MNTYLDYQAGSELGARLVCTRVVIERLPFFYAFVIAKSSA